jgi:glutathione synthase/RimK-type ligase-like ATP-grasp enzyme
MAFGSRHIGSKWKKTKALLKDRRVRSYVPATRIMSAHSLHDMLSRYRVAYVKPVLGMHGKGVARVERSHGAYKYKWGTQTRSFHSFDAMYASLLRRKSRRRYLVQQGIHLLKHKGRPFDIRVMVQRNASRDWETTGIIARVAGKGKVVTNYHNGGTLMELGQLLKPRIGSAASSEYAGRLARIGRHSASALGRTYPAIDTIGADIGIDRSYRPWIIEVNTSPDPYIFRHLKDRRISRKVLRYARALGRIQSRARRGR